MGKDVKYEDISELGSQYDDIEFEPGKPVDAKYIKPLVESDEGNIFIEALPPLRNDLEIEAAYRVTIPSYSLDKVKDLSKLEKVLAVEQLKSIRYQLPFHERLEFEFYKALIQSYRAKKPLFSNNMYVTLQILNETVCNSGILVGDSACATNAGFALIGFSGCGKSSSIYILVSRYPQVIIHKMGNGCYFPQIVYLVVNCIANSNFSALYEGIGDAIDKALGNIEPVYAKEISKARNLGSKAEKVRELIEKFAIGAIIFDEIQLIDFEHTQENTFDSLLTLANKTKTAIIVVGTEDAKDKMFSELRTTRRLGVIINGNAYCNNKKFFDILADQLFAYQWFDEPVECTQEIKDTLYELTKGIIDQLVSLYSAVQIEYLTSKKQKKPTINGDYFRKISQKYYPGIQNVLANLENVENVQKLNDIRTNAEKMLQDAINDDEEEQDKQADKIIQSASRNADIDSCFINVVAVIRAIYKDYSDDQIRTAFNKVITRKDATNMDDGDIARAVLERLQKLPSKPRKTGKVDETIDTEHMVSFLGISGSGA